jgi:hypothetical protein
MIPELRDKENQKLGRFGTGCAFSRDLLKAGE